KPGIPVCSFCKPFRGFELRRNCLGTMLLQGRKRLRDNRGERTERDKGEGIYTISVFICGRCVLREVCVDRITGFFRIGGMSTTKRCTMGRHRFSRSLLPCSWRCLLR